METHSTKDGSCRQPAGGWNGRPGLLNAEVREPPPRRVLGPRVRAAGGVSLQTVLHCHKTRDCVWRGMSMPRRQMEAVVSKAH